MEFQLNEIGITLIVGAFTLLTVEFISQYTFGKPLTGFFHKRVGLQDAGETNVFVFLFLCFGIGLVAENLFSKYVDIIDVSGLSRRVLCHRGLVKDLEFEDGSKFSRETLEVVAVVKGLHTEHPRRTGLGQELVEHQLFSRVDADRGRLVEQWLAADRPLPLARTTLTAKMVEDSVSRLWYASKNSVFRQQNYYDELRAIRRRQDFSRTIASLAYLGGTFALVFGVAVAVAFLIAVDRPRFRCFLLTHVFPGSTTGGFAVQKTRSRVTAGHFAIHALGRTLALFAIYFLCLWAYTLETMEFNKRVFGYFNSLLLNVPPAVTAPASPAPPSASPASSRGFIDQTRRVIDQSG